MWYFYATVGEKPVYILGCRIVHFLSTAQSDSKALYRFLSADEIKKTAVCVWCAFQQRDLPVSSRYGLRGEFLWGGLNSSLSSFPPPLPSILAEHKQLAGLYSTCTACFATALLTGNNKPRSKVKRDCGARILVRSSGKHCARRHGKQCPTVWLRDTERESELAWKTEGGYEKPARPRPGFAKICCSGPLG